MSSPHANKLLTPAEMDAEFVAACRNAAEVTGLPYEDCELAQTEAMLRGWVLLSPEGVEKMLDILSA